MNVTQAALDLILEFEIGGGESTYNKLYRYPTWPGASSGVTIGIGYDLGYNSEAQFRRDWEAHLGGSTKAFLGSIGKKGSEAKGHVAPVKAIAIPWEAAVTVFTESTIPRYWKMTTTAFPGAEKLHGDIQGALLSLVFNRGSSVSGSRRREMAQIRSAIQEGSPEEIPGLLRKMVWVWKGTEIERGMVRRRNAEAALAQKGLDAGTHPTPQPAAAPSVVLAGKPLDGAKLIDGVTYVPVRAAAERLGWTIPIAGNGSVTLAVGAEAYEVPFLNLDGTGHVTARDIADIRGKGIAWDPKTRTVTVE